jgi:hypothetical protein
MVAVGGEQVTFGIGGRYTPDVALIAHARDILDGFSEFEASVAAFLRAEADRKLWAQFAGEIRSLKIREIYLFWPKRPDEGMIFFDGPDDDRCWRCYHVARRPTGLGFDS